MNHIIKADLFRYNGSKGFIGLLHTLFIPGFRYTFLLRKAAQQKKYFPLWFFYRMLLRKYSIKYGFQIYPNTVIGKGLYIGHFGTIIINGKAIIGNYCNLASGVTIGQTNRGIKCGTPTIGDKVWIGTNAIIVGKITIGNNVLIAPNAYVNTDVPSNSLVIGNPAQIIAKDNPTKDYIDFI